MVAVALAVEKMNMFRRLFSGINKKDAKKTDRMLDGFVSDSDDDEEDEKYKYQDRKEEMMLLNSKFGTDETHMAQMKNNLRIRPNNKLLYLGHGAFSIVKKCWSEKYDSEIAVKIILLSDEASNSYVKNFLPKELKIWGEFSKANHPNVLNMLESFSNRAFTYIAMDVADNGDLLKLLQFGPLTEYKARTVFRGILAALCFLHEGGIAHRDIKPENLLLTKNDKIKLADFSFVTKDNPVSCERCGTPGFLAPEQRDCGYYDPFMSDMWQVGLTLYYMFFTSSPFTSTRKKHLLVEIAECKNKYRNVPMPANRMLSKNGRDLLAGLLQIEVPSRWNVKHVKASYWLNPLGPDSRDYPILSKE